MDITLNKLTKGQPDWHIPLNENTDTIMDAFANFEGGGGGGAFQEQIDEVRAIAESRLPETYENGTDIDTITTAGAYGIVDPVSGLMADDVAFLTLRGGGNNADKLHQIAFPFADDGKAPSMYTRTLSDSTWTDWSLRASGAKLLWSGSWSSGSITVPDFSKYCAFILTMEGQGTTMPVYRAPGSGFMRGMNGYTSATPTIVTYHFACTVSGETLTFVACNNMTQIPSAGHGAYVNNVVSGLWGVVLSGV